MLLTEKTQETLDEAFESFEHKQLDKVALTEWFESDKSEIRADIVEAVAKMAQLEEKFINETNFSANIANFTPRLQPLLRRIAPKLMAFDIAAVQPIAMPTTEIFMVKAQYSGSTGAVADRDTSVILELTQGTTARHFVVGDTLTSASGVVGTVVYFEPGYGKAVVNITAGTPVAGDKFDVGAAYSAVDTTDDITVNAVYSNEAGFKQILPNYSGSYTTAQAEVLGSDMKQLRVNIVSQSVTAKSRKMKAEITIELIKDMQNIHGASAEKEIMFFLESEIINDINMELIGTYKSISVSLPNYALASSASTIDVGKGRWSQEMYSGLYDRIIKDMIDVSTRNRRGQANILVATAGVITALQSLKLLQTVGVKAADNHADTFVGTLPNGAKVYQDWFSTTEYFMPIYKGASLFDAGIIYSPYVPIEIISATNATTLQPVLGISSRYALSRNVLLDNPSLSVSDYSSIRIVDFTATPIA